MKLIFILLFFLLLFNATSIAQASPQFNTEEVFEIRESITYEVAQEFIKSLPSTRYLVLNSKGGILEYSYLIARLVKVYKITTVVPENSICESACTLIFQAGNERLIHKTASLMYHGTRYRKVDMQYYFTNCPSYPLPEECIALYESMREHVKTETLRLFRTLEEYGLSKTLFNRFINQPIEKNWLQNGNLTGKRDLRIDANEAVHYNAATKIFE